MPGLGLRCVSDRPWVTGAETCELVLALCALGDHDAGGRSCSPSMQHLRHDDGSYWTGYVYPDDARWPEERTTWTAGAVLLAAAALAGDPATQRRCSAAHRAADRAPTRSLVGCRHRPAGLCTAQHP